MIVESNLHILVLENRLGAGVRYNYVVQHPAVGTSTASFRL